MFFPKDKQQKMGGAWGVILTSANMGMQIVAGTVIGLVVGWWLDNWLGTRPWLTLIMLVLGIVAGFKNVYEDVRKIQKSDEPQMEPRKEQHDG